MADSQPQVRLAIVGTRVLACPGDRERAKTRAATAIKRLSPGIVISGGAEGSDKIGEETATEFGYSEAAGTLIVFRPRVRRFHGPGGFRERDEQIAQACTHLLRISCRRATTYGSGWTADRAEELGAVVVRYSACPETSETAKTVTLAGPFPGRQTSTNDTPQPSATTRSGRVSRGPREGEVALRPVPAQVISNTV